MNKYDITIVGGGTSGVSCAWNAAKLGLKTLLIEKNSFLGGTITSSLVIPAMKTSKKSINNDFFNELYKNLEYVNGAITYGDGNQGWFNPELTKIILDSMLLEAGVDILFETNIKKVDIKDDKILISIDSIDTNKICNDNKILSISIESIYLVDSTGDGKICKNLNAKFLQNKKEKFQPASLRFIMSGINLKEFSNWLIKFDSNRNVTTSYNIDNNIHLSTAYTWDRNSKWALEPLFKEAIDSGDIKEEDSNYFQIFTIAGTPDSIAFNAPRLTKNYKNISTAYIEARQSILRLANFCKKYLPGFKDAYISSIANSMGIRYSGSVRGKYIYTYNDLITGKKFKNPVLVSDYPVDIHSNKKNCSTLKKVNIEYQLPLESLMVEGFDNLFVIGRTISAEFEAQAALRIIPSCFSMGEGLAKYLAKTNH